MNTPHDLSHQFSDEQLRAIIEDAVIYMCACPAQVAEQIMHLRGLFAYQQRCLRGDGLSEAVHGAIAESTQRAHDELERCLDQVLTMEGWNRDTMTMPAGLRKIRDEHIERI